jgi:peptidoglycan/LPS O-acetylase OafA/YrhL
MTREDSTYDRGKRFVVLDSWRGIAALMVAYTHFPAFSHVYNFVQVRNGPLFVDLFFVLSGFVIAANYKDRIAQWPDLARFMFLRFGRLYPLHFAILLAFIAMECAHALLDGAAGGATGNSFTGTRAASTIIPELFLLQASGLFGIGNWNRPAWTISVEFYNYLVFAIIFIASGRHLLRCILVVVPALAVLMAYLVWHDFYDNDNGTGIVRCAYGFSAGVLALLIYERCGHDVRAAIVPSSSWNVLEILLVCALIGFISFHGYHIQQPLAPVVFAFVIFIFAFEGGTISRVLKARPMIYLGLWSYSIYMVHAFVAAVAANAAHLVKILFGVDLIFGDPTTPYQMFGNNVWIGDLLYVPYTLVVVSFAAMTYNLVERPMRELSRSIAHHHFVDARMESAVSRR